MRKCYPYYLLIGAFLLIKCSDDKQIQPSDHFVIPNDKLAFYKIEEPRFYCYEIFIDSITKLGERVIEYDQIISYDTSNFIFEIAETAADTIKNINLRYKNYCMPIAVISNSNIIFGCYLYHDLCSGIPYWFSIFLTHNKYLTIYFPEGTVKPLDPDPRMDPRIIQVLINDNKLK
jgi:hypothetical protein